MGVKTGAPIKAALVATQAAYALAGPATLPRIVADGDRSAAVPTKILDPKGGNDVATKEQSSEPTLRGCALASICNLLILCFVVVGK